MPPDTLKLVVFAEELAVLAARAVADLRSVIVGSNAKDVATILNDADATYNEIITRAKS